jgi:hypothetical protein
MQARQGGVDHGEHVLEVGLGALVGVFDVERPHQSAGPNVAGSRAVRCSPPSGRSVHPGCTGQHCAQRFRQWLDTALRVVMSVMQATFSFVRNDPPPTRWPLLRRWIRTRGTLFWAVVATAVFIGGLFAASQIAHDRHQSVDWYTGFGQWLGALGSFVAAGAALLIATRDRRERSRERLATHEAEARLVVVSELYNTTGKYTVTFGMHYHNYGARPILDISLAKMDLRAYPQAIARLNDRLDRLTRSEEATSFEDVAFVDETGEPVPPPREDSKLKWPDFETHDVVGWVTFSDVHGNRWAKSSDDRLRRIRNDGDLAYLD